jgi:hypothetical protein
MGFLSSRPWAQRRAVAMLQKILREPNCHGDKYRQRATAVLSMLLNESEMA